MDLVIQGILHPLDVNDMTLLSQFREPEILLGLPPHIKGLQVDGKAGSISPLPQNRQFLEPIMSLKVFSVLCVLVAIAAALPQADSSSSVVAAPSNSSASSDPVITATRVLEELVVTEPFIITTTEILIWTQSPPTTPLPTAAPQA